MAALGAAIAAGDDHRDVFQMVGRPDWRDVHERFEQHYGGFQASDLYPDAVASLDALRRVGYRISIFANQPARRTARAPGARHRARPDGHERRVGRAQAGARVLSRARWRRWARTPRDVAYVGDRLDNDVRPSAAAGIRPVWLRRGPWGVIGGGEIPDGTLVVDSLSELVERIPEWWP